MREVNLFPLGTAEDEVFMNLNQVLNLFLGSEPVL